MDEFETKAMTMREAGRKGGQATKARYGKEFFQEIGRKGGSVTKESYGTEHFEKLGKKGGSRLKELVEKGRETEK